MELQFATCPESRNVTQRESNGRSMGAPLTRERSFEPLPRHRYTPPASIQQTDLWQILRQSARGDLAPKQLSLLEQGTGADARSTPVYYAGDLDLVKDRCIAVIGTRNVTEVGRKRANKFARELVEAGVVVVSGLAQGVDAQALGGAITNGGRVIAVIGTPLDKAYPAANASLQEEIYRGHLLISQFAIGERTYPSNFVARNRTMAAITDASVIIEATESSGTLHQASECVKLGRWLGISKSVVEDSRLSWPAQFIDYPKCVVLESTAELLAKVYQE